jgi:regulator of sigma E protease
LENLIYIFGIIFTFMVLVVTHELGHFWAAKLMGVRVEKFSIGFSPSLITKKWGDTEYSIGLIPLGGFVKMAGVIDESMDDNIKGEPWEFTSKSPLARIFILSAGVVMNVITAILIYWGVYYFDGKEQHTPVVGIVAENTVAEDLGLRSNDLIVAVNGESVSSYEAFIGRYLENFKEGTSITVFRDSTLTDLIFDANLVARHSPQNLGFRLRSSTRITALDTTLSAAAIGMLPGDIITRIDTLDLRYYHDIGSLIADNPGKKMPIVYTRDGQTLRDSIVIATIEKESEDGTMSQTGRIGVAFGESEKRKVYFGAGEALGVAFTDAYDYLNQNMIGFGMVLTGQTPAKEAVGGMITIAAVTGSIAQQGFLKLLILIAQLSLILALFNILPIPVLDGGHISIILYEVIRGKPLSLSTKLTIQKYGMIFILILIVLVLYVDINRIWG